MFYALYWVFCCAFACDFRGEEGGNPIQYLFLAAALGSGAIMIATTPTAFSTKPVRLLTLLWWVYLASTAVVMVEAHVPPSQYLRCVLPPLLCGMGIIIGQAMHLRSYTAEQVIKPLIYAGMVSVVFRFIHAVYIQGIPIEQVRFEMLSPAIPLLFSVAVASAILGKKLNMLWVCGGAMALVSVMISVTRSYILTLIFAAMAAGVGFFIMLLAGAWTTKDFAKKTRHFGIGTIVIVLSMAALCLVQPIVFERWFDRLFNDGGGKTKQEVTYLTRAAEAKVMWDLLEEDPVRFVYGKGLGATYWWDRTYFPELLKVYGDIEIIDSDHWVPGHSVWTYSLFTGGFYAVACYLFLFGWLTVMGIAGAKASLRLNSAPPEMGFLPMIVGLCYFSQTLTANPFGERFSAQILGLCAALPQFFLYARAQAEPWASSHATPFSHHYAPPPVNRLG